MVDRVVRSAASQRLASLLLDLVIGAAAMLALVSCSRTGVGLPASAGHDDRASQPARPSPLASASPAPVRPASLLSQPTPTPAIPAVVRLSQATLDGAPLARGAWTVRGVVLQVQAPTTFPGPLVPEVELARLGQPFQGRPTARGAPEPSGGSTAVGRVVLKDLPPGQYAWQARLASPDGRSAGPWARFAGDDAAFGIAGDPPALAAVRVTGLEHRAGGIPVIGPQDQPRVAWTVVDAVPAALDGVRYLIDHQPTAPPAPPAAAARLNASGSGLALNDQHDGTWYIHLWAVDRAGQTSAPATVAVSVLREPLQFEDVIYRTWATNPLYQTAPIRFTLSRAATVSVTIMADGSTRALRTYDLGRRAAGERISLAWDGKDAAGRIVPPGSYRFLIEAVDDAGTHTQAVYDGLTITNKVIRIWLGRQVLTAYDGDTPFLTTLITSGGADLPTPVGTFEILQKSTPFVFHSPFPRGSKYWFPDVKSNFAMLFDQADADFIHDAPWRTRFGPGTNGPGIPGQPFTGSHGCVETPVSVMPRLYPWTPLGTPVVITP
ncbi:MAG: L,D-transpeptidase family protein [Chloroflexi bacterium]|nr:L,D-transpeptidase family protein [Chloroflexota bacterium]